MVTQDGSPPAAVQVVRVREVAAVATAGAQTQAATRARSPVEQQASAAAEARAPFLVAAVTSFARRAQRRRAAIASAPVLAVVIHTRARMPVAAASAPISSYAPRGLRRAADLNRSCGKRSPATSASLFSHVAIYIRTRDTSVVHETSSPRVQGRRSGVCRCSGLHVHSTRAIERDERALPLEITEGQGTVVMGSCEE